MNIYEALKIVLNHSDSHTPEYEDSEHYSDPDCAKYDDDLMKASDILRKFRKELHEDG